VARTYAIDWAEFEMDTTAMRESEGMNRWMVYVANISRWKTRREPFANGAAAGYRPYHQEQE